MPRKYLTRKNKSDKPTSKHTNKRNEVQKEKDKELIIKLLRKGTYTYQNITDEVNKKYKAKKIDLSLSINQIRNDIAKILKDLVSERIEDTYQMVCIQEKRYLKLAEEALESWEQSKITKAKKRHSKRWGEHTMNNWEEEQEELIPSEGDIKYLSFAKSCYEKIDKLNGLYMTKKEMKEEETGEETEEIEAEIDIPDNGRDENKTEV